MLPVILGRQIFDVTAQLGGVLFQTNLARRVIRERLAKRSRRAGSDYPPAGSEKERMGR